jgi:formyltetrahydrofolate deformylase
VTDTPPAFPPSASPPPSDYVLTLSCPDRPGIVYAVSKFLVDHGGNIVESQQYDDRQVGTFFMRVQFEPYRDARVDLPRLRADFAAVSAPFDMTWRLLASTDKQRVLVMVSRLGHCLNDLLFRCSVGGLQIEVPAVVSNHPDRLAGHYGIAFHHVPVSAVTKPAAEARLLELVHDLDIDLVVLARYMQVLSPDLCRRLEGRVINIHHSILPSFTGARPYHQAHQRGVKLVGATAHYVTPELDEGPIIEQEVARVDHSMSADDVVALGRDIECQALARAVRWHTENRVLLHGGRTVVLQ